MADEAVNDVREAGDVVLENGDAVIGPRADGECAADRARSDPAWDLAVLSVAVGVVLAAFALEVVPPDRIALRGFSQYPLPHLCPSRWVLDIACPGCGLTRSVIHLAQGDWRASLTVHRLGWLVLAVIVCQIPWRTWRLVRPNAVPATSETSEGWLWGGLAALLTVNRLAEMAEGWLR